MKKLLISVAILIALGAGIYVGVSGILKGKVLGFSNPSTQTLVGSATNYVLLPNAKVFASTTSTAALADGGTLNQIVTTKNYDKVYLDIQGVCGNATSTTYIEPEISYDGTYFYQPLTPTSTQNLSGTSSLALLGQQVDFILGTASTSPGYSLEFLTYGAPYMRFLIYADNEVDNPVADNSDGCQTWIEYRNAEKVTNY